MLCSKQSISCVRSVWMVEIKSNTKSASNGVLKSYATEAAFFLIHKTNIHNGKGKMLEMLLQDQLFNYTQ